MELGSADLSAMFAYAYDRHRRDKSALERRAHRESLVESMIDWLISFHDAHSPIFSSAGIRVPGKFLGIDRQRSTVKRDGRTDIELEFANARTIVELKVGARLDPGQLRAYIDDLAKDRSERPKGFARHVIVVVRDGDWPALERQMKAFRKDGTIAKSSGVRVAATTYGRIAAADPTGRWKSIKVLSDDLVAPRTPVAGTPHYFRKKALADWVNAALVEATQLSDPAFHEELKRHAAEFRGKKRRPAGRIGTRRPAFSTDTRNTHAWFHAYGSTDGPNTAATVEINPWYLGLEDEGLVTVSFSRKYSYLEVPLPASVPEPALADIAQSALESVWHVLWSAVERLREEGWSTPKNQPALSDLGLLPVYLANKSGRRIEQATLFFDPRWSTWRKHGPIGLIFGKADLSDEEISTRAWWLPHESGQEALSEWIKWAVDELVQRVLLGE